MIRWNSQVWTGISPFQTWLSFCFLHWLHGHVDDLSDGVGGFSSGFLCCMSVGVEGEACRVVTQCAGQGFHIYAVLQGGGCEGVPEVMESDVLNTCRFQNLFVGVAAQRAAIASISTKAPLGRSFTAKAARAGQFSVKNFAYTSFIAPKSEMFARSTVVFTTSA